MKRVNAECKVWWAIDFFGWSMPTLGLSIDALLQPAHDAPRWFRVKLGLLFLHVQLHIEGRRTPDEEDE